jgi:hypothetical protein
MRLARSQASAAVFERQDLPLNMAVRIPSPYAHINAVIPPSIGYKRHATVLR